MYKENITENAWAQLNQVIEHPDFVSMDDQMIYDCLLNNLELVPFSVFLKRFLHRQANLSTPFEETPDSVYLEMMLDSFRENVTPSSFVGETISLRQNISAWLTQQNARRSTVLLLGFGLLMSLDEVNSFLTKTLRQQALDLSDPFELCCAYCYLNQYRFPRFSQLWSQYSSYSKGIRKLIPVLDLSAIRDDDALLLQMLRLKHHAETSSTRDIAQQTFLRLYDSAREWTVAYFNNTTTHKVYTSREDVSARDLERILSAAIPQSTNGNLIPSSKSTLNEPFDGKFFNRQRISEILSGRVPVDRFDLLTLHFFNCTQDHLETDETPRERFNRFLNEGNRLLHACSFSEIYPANPYEAFLLMCIICDEPLSTYADVWEKAYQNITKKGDE